MKYFYLKIIYHKYSHDILILSMEKIFPKRIKKWIMSKDRDSYDWCNNTDQQNMLI